MTIKAKNIILYVEHPWLLKDVKYLLTSCFKAYLWVDAWFCILHSSCTVLHIAQFLSSTINTCFDQVDAWLCILHILAWFCTLHNSCPPPSILVLTKLMHDCAYYIFLHGFGHCTIPILNHQHLFWLSWCMNLHNTYFLHGYAHYTILVLCHQYFFLWRKFLKIEWSFSKFEPTPLRNG